MTTHSLLEGTLGPSWKPATAAVQGVQMTIAACSLLPRQNALHSFILMTTVVAHLLCVADDPLCALWTLISQGTYMVP